MKTARVIILMRCQRSCAGCCNTFSQITARAAYIASVDALAGYDMICITGGEPMLDPERTLRVVGEIRRAHPAATVTLYSALCTTRTAEVMDAVDGIHYTLHEGATKADVAGFQRFQELAAQRRGKSFRVYIDPRVEHVVTLLPRVWARAEIKPWMSEDELIAHQPDGLPRDETLFVLRNDAEDKLIARYPGMAPSDALAMLRMSGGKS